MRCTSLTGSEVAIVVHGELPSGPFIGVHILMSQTQNERQEARSALNTVISSSKKTTGVSSTSPPLGRPSPLHSGPLIFKQSGWRVEGEEWPLLGQPTGSIDGWPLAGQWLNQGPSGRPSAGAAVGFYPRWAWMCPLEEMLQSQSLVFVLTGHYFFLAWAKYITQRCHIPAQNLKLSYLTCWVSKISSGWIIMLLTDIHHIALGLLEQKTLCKSDRNHKKAISSWRAGMKTLQLIFTCCTHTDHIWLRNFNLIFTYIFNAEP